MFKLDENLDPILNTLTGIGLMETVGIAIENFKPFNKLADNLKMNQLKSQKIDQKTANKQRQLFGYLFKDSKYDYQR